MSPLWMRISGGSGAEFIGDSIAAMARNGSFPWALIRKLPAPSPRALDFVCMRVSWKARSNMGANVKNGPKPTLARPLEKHTAHRRPVTDSNCSLLDVIRPLLFFASGHRAPAHWRLWVVITRKFLGALITFSATLSPYSMGLTFRFLYRARVVECNQSPISPGFSGCLRSLTISTG